MSRLSRLVALTPLTFALLVTAPGGPRPVGATGCDPNYIPCVPPPPPDLNCDDLRFAVRVVGVDVHRLDGNGDGTGCENYGTPPPKPAGSLLPLVPGRLMDTRVPASPTVDGLFQAIGLRGAGSTTELQVAGRGGIPETARAVALNVTVTGAQADGYITVWPCGDALPNASSLNYSLGQTIPNAVITRVGSGGKVCFFAEGATHLLVDYNGYFPESTSYVPMTPGRLMDSRSPASPTVDGLFQAIGLRGAGSTTELQVAGRGGIPETARAVALNVTVTGAQADGYITVWPCGDALPNASSLNYSLGQTIPNAVIARVGSGGKVCFFAEGATHLLVDYNGYFPAVSSLVTTGPSRLMDSRKPSSPTVDGNFQAIGIRGAGSTTELQVVGRAGIPTSATAVTLNVTVTGAQSGGFITVWPCGDALPNASNLNYAAGQTIPNAVITRIGSGGRVCLFTEAAAHLIVDINGYFVSGA